MRKVMFVGIAYAFVHFSVEVASFYFLFSRISITPFWWILALLFDAVAFIPQSIIGIITDKYPKFNVGLIGNLLIIAALLIKADLFALVVIALGNAFVHVSGAQYTLRGTQGKITPNAVFIGAGSFGVITGQLLGMANNIGVQVFPILLMLLSGVVICYIQKKDNLDDKIADFDISVDMNIAAIVLFSFIGVAVRGYFAYAIPTEWNKTIPQTIALFIFMGIGKMLGGILSDCIGFRKVTFISLLGGLPFLLFGNTNMVLSLIGIALFSMTMPVTVAVLASGFPKQTGLAFGITTIGLFIGTAPAFFIRPETLFAHQFFVIILTAVALPAISICIKKGR